VTRARGAAPAVFALAAVAPLCFSAGGNVLNNMVLAAAYVVMALGLNLIVGFAGLLDLGYVAFFAIGAYTAAYFGSGFWADANLDVLVSDRVADLPGIHVNFLLILVLAVAGTAVAGTLIGVPTLRLRGDYVAMVTLAFGEIVSKVVSNGRSIELFGGTLTSGPIGIGPIDRIELPLLGRFDAVNLRPWYWVALALVALVLVANRNLRRSRVGRAWIAMRHDEAAAAAAGIPIVRTKLLAYGTGAACGGIAGAFLASYLGIVNAVQFEFSFSIFILAMVVVGGAGSIPGVVAGAIALSVLNSYLLPDVLAPLPRTLGLAFDLPVISSGLYGAILLFVMLLWPRGLASAFEEEGGGDGRHADGAGAHHLDGAERQRERLAPRVAELGAERRRTVRVHRVAIDGAAEAAEERDAEGAAELRAGLEDP
jgi:branched-chain amino acid transport system permease protein